MPLARRPCTFTAAVMLYSKHALAGAPACATFARTAAELPEFLNKPSAQQQRALSRHAWAQLVAIAAARATSSLSFLNQRSRTYGVIGRQDTGKKALKRGCNTAMSFNRTTIKLQSATETDFACTRRLYGVTRHGVGSATGPAPRSDPLPS